MIAATLVALLAATAAASPTYTRSECTVTSTTAETCASLVDVCLEPPGEWTYEEVWFVAWEIALLNGVALQHEFPAGAVIHTPGYRRARVQCGDIRNWHVAVTYGRKHGVHPALMIAVRGHENPKRSRDRYAYGVVCRKYTNLRTQADWGGKIIARIAKEQGWDPMEPTHSRLLRLGRVYCGHHEHHWRNCVWALYKRANGTA